MRSLIAGAAGLYLRLVAATTRVVWAGRDVPRGLERAGRSLVYAFWHARQASLAFTHRNQPVCVLVSRSKDGELIASVMDGLGLRAARGSSSRGASEGVRELLSRAREGYRLGLTPDGPRGPAREVKPGALFVAEKLGAPVVPIAAGASRKLVFRKSWDRFEVPLPFGRVAVVHADPVDPSGPGAARRLQEALDRATAEADGLASGAGAGPLFAAYNLLFPLLGLGVLLQTLLSPRRGLLRGLGAELGERFGWVPGSPAGRRVLWVHAASVGEVKALAGLLPALRRGLEADGGSAPYLLVTASSRAGREEAAALPGVDDARLAPLDWGPVVRRAFRRIRPSAHLVAETELWPNSLAHAARSGVRVFIVNGRISAKSASRYRWIRPMLAETLAAVDRVWAQTAEDAERYRALGARPDRVEVTGNLKHDRSPAVEGPGLRDRLGWPAGCPVLAAGSTHPVEEEQVLEAYLRLRRERPGLRLVLAPRHVERAADVERLLRSKGLAVAALSRPGAGSASADCLLLDALGALLQAYAAADVAYVGGTLAPKGGHNLMEPAALGVPVLFGPSVETVKELAQALLREGGGRQVDGAESLAREAGAWLADPAARRLAGERARKACRGFQGATDRVLRGLLSRFPAA